MSIRVEFLLWVMLLVAWSDSAQSSTMFGANKGQWDEQILYRVDNGGATTWLTADGLYHQFTRQVAADEGSDAAQQVLEPREPGEAAPEYECLMVKTAFVNANPDPAVIGLEALDHKSHYFLGNKPERWQTNVPSYSAVIYDDVYPGIDLKYYGHGLKIEYDFIVAPGADPTQIQIQYTNAKLIWVNESGDLVIETDWGEIREKAPYAYQHEGAKTREVTGSFELHDTNTFGFRITDAYDRSLPLVIDPVLNYSTCIGGSSNEYATALGVDDDGCAFVVGYTLSADFPLDNANQTNPIPYPSGYVSKLGRGGDSLLYSTYIGSGGWDCPYGAVVDRDGSVYLAGETNSDDFPNVSAFQTEYGGNSDGFALKLSASGDSLIYSTYVGGSYEDAAYDITSDVQGVAYVIGRTTSPDFPVRNQYQLPPSVGFDAFLVQIGETGATMAYGTCIGGTGEDVGSGIEVDGQGNVYLAGKTQSTDFPTCGACQSYQGGWDAFVTKMNNAGDTLLYSTYLGGTDEESNPGLSVDRSGCAYISGWTISDDYPTKAPFQAVRQDYSTYLTKLSADCDSLVYSTYLAGSGRDYAVAVDVDELGNAYVTGRTASTDFPTVTPLQGDAPDLDIFIAKFNSSGTDLLFSTYLGGGGRDYAYDIEVRRGMEIFVTGTTVSADFPLVNPFQTYQGSGDVFVSKIVIPCCAPPTVGDIDQSGIVDITDISVLVDHQFISFEPLVCEEEADVNLSGTLDITDLSAMIDNQFINLTAFPECP